MNTILQELDSADTLRPVTPIAGLHDAEELSALHRFADALDQPVFLVDAECRLLGSNDPARELLAPSGPLHLVGSRLEPSDDTNRRRWGQAVARAVGSGHALDAIFAGHHRLGFSAVRLAAPAIVAVIFATHGAGHEAALHATRSRFGLTPCETRVLADLLGGLTAKAIAVRRGVSESTVRTQIKGLLAKSGTRSTRQLAICALSWPGHLEVDARVAVR